MFRQACSGCRDAGIIEGGNLSTPRLLRTGHEFFTGAGRHGLTLPAVARRGAGHGVRLARHHGGPLRLVPDIEGGRRVHGAREDATANGPPLGPGDAVRVRGPGHGVDGGGVGVPALERQRISRLICMT